MKWGLVLYLSTVCIAIANVDVKVHPMFGAGCCKFEFLSYCICLGKCMPRIDWTWSEVLSISNQSCGKRICFSPVLPGFDRQYMRVLLVTRSYRGIGQIGFLRSFWFSISSHSHSVRTLHVRLLWIHLFIVKSGNMLVFATYNEFAMFLSVKMITYILLNVCDK